MKLFNWFKKKEEKQYPNAEEPLRFYKNYHFGPGNGTAPDIETIAEGGPDLDHSEALAYLNKRLPIIALEKLLDKSFKYIVLQEDLIDINSAAEHSGVYGLKGYAVIDLFKFPELREVLYKAAYKYLTEKVNTNDNI